MKVNDGKISSRFKKRLEVTDFVPTVNAKNIIVRTCKSWGNFKDKELNRGSRTFWDTKTENLTPTGLIEDKEANGNNCHVWENGFQRNNNAVY